MTAQLLQVALGVWLIVAPDALHLSGSSADSLHIVGPTIAALGLVATRPCTRMVRLAIIPSALWLLCSPLALASPKAATANALATGTAVLGLCFFRGRLADHYGGGWMALLHGRRPTVGRPGRQSSDAPPITTNSHASNQGATS